MEEKKKEQKKKTSSKSEKKEVKPRKKKEQHYCPNCGKAISPDATRCIECEHKQQRRAEWPQKDELKELIRTNSFSSIGKQFNVSDNAVRRWCKNYGLPYKKSEIKKYSDEEWLTI